MNTHHSVINITMPMAPLRQVDSIIARGRVRDASCSSSDLRMSISLNSLEMKVIKPHICAPESGPMKNHKGLAMPTNVLRPVLPQPPPS